MFHINKDDKSVPPKLILSGIIDEAADLSPLLEGNPRALHLDCRNVSRINSIGVKLWREFFGRYRKGGGRAHFFNLSPALVSPLNYLSDFAQKDEIRSICVPFMCLSCEKTTIATYTTDELTKLNLNLTPPPCAACGAKTEMDEIPEEYFSFLTK